MSVGAVAANAEAPWWKVGFSVRPTLLPASGHAEIVVTASDIGDLAIGGATNPVTITDKLPSGVRATEIVAGAGLGGSRGAVNCPTMLPSETVTCEWAGPEPLPAYELFEIRIAVEVDATPGSAQNEVKISGGEGYLCKKLPGNTGEFKGAFCGVPEKTEEHNGGFEAEPTGVPVPSASMRRLVHVGSGATSFGVEQYELTPENEGGSSDVQAGSHPFQLTTAFALNETANPETPPALAKDVRFQWPPGLVGETFSLPQCTESEFSTTFHGLTNRCPADTAVGVASVTFVLHHGGPGTFLVPVFNLVPAPGEPARFGFVVLDTATTVDTSVRTGGNYGVTVNVNNITETASFLSSRVTIWGTPADPRHDLSRGWNCIAGGSWNFGQLPQCAAVAGEGQTTPFLTLPTSCTGPLESSGEIDSWSEPGRAIPFSLTAPLEGLTGCERLPFSARLEVTPDSNSASTPTGLSVKVKVPQEASTNPNGLAASDVRDTTVTLPEGMTLNPAGAGGLQACSEAEIGYLPKESAPPEDLRFTSGLPAPKEAPTEPFCPDASKIGTVKITTPILRNPFKGVMYLAAQEENPFGSLLAMYLVAEEKESGVLLKLPGEVSVNPVTGQLTSTFKNTPQAPFEDLELHFFGGERAPLSTPPLCKGGYLTTASFTPWSDNEPGTGELGIRHHLRPARGIVSQSPAVRAHAHGRRDEHPGRCVYAVHDDDEPRRWRPAVAGRPATHAVRLAGDALGRLVVPGSSGERRRLQ